MKMLVSLVILFLAITCCLCTSEPRGKANRKAIALKEKGSLLDLDLADHLDSLIVDWHTQLLSGASKEDLSQFWDPVDAQIMYPDTTTLTDPMVIADALVNMLLSFPAGTVAKGTMVEAYSFRFRGFRVANAICRNVGRDANGNIIFIARASQVWRQFGKKWKLHRENVSFECFMNC